MSANRGVAMPAPDLHTPNAAPFILGVGSILYGALEAQLIVAFLCAVLGAGIGLAYMPAPKPATSRWDLLLRFAGNAGYILLTGIVTMFALHWLRKMLPGAEYPSSFFGGMLIMLFRDKIITGIGRLIDRKLDGV
jgi:hypothetical protein